MAEQRVLIPFIADGKYGYLDRSGRVVVKSTYEYASASSEGIAIATLVDKPDTVVLLDTNGLEVTRVDHFELGGYSFSHGLLAGKDLRTSPDLEGYINPQGEFVIKPQFRSASPFTSTGATVRVRPTDKKVTRINRLGIPVGKQFLSIRPFHPEGTCCGATVEWGNTKGEVAINGKGEYLSRRRFDIVWQEHEGLIPVQFDPGVVGWLDDQGAEVFRFEARAIGNHFESGLVPVEGPNEKWGFMNTAGRWVIEPDFDFVESVGPNRFQVGNLAGKDITSVRLIDSCGNFMGREVFERIGRFSEGVAKVWRVPDPKREDEQEFNFIDLQGNLISPHWSRTF